MITDHPFWPCSGLLAAELIQRNLCISVTRMLDTRCLILHKLAIFFYISMWMLMLQMEILKLTSHLLNKKKSLLPPLLMNRINKTRYRMCIIKKNMLIFHIWNDSRKTKTTEIPFFSASVSLWSAFQKNNIVCYPSARLGIMFKNCRSFVDAPIFFWFSWKLKLS